MRIRLAPLAIAVIAASVAVVAAVSFGAALMPFILRGLQHHANPALIGIWVAIFGGGLPLVYTVNRRAKAKRDDVRRWRRPDRSHPAPDRSLDP
jgi:hypothetical protein